MRMTVLATKHLLLRPLDHGDLPALEAIFADREHMWDLMDIPGRSNDAGELARYYLERSLWAFARYRAGMWGMRPRSGTDEPILGYTGFVINIGDRIDISDEIEAGWAVARHAGGRGHAMEGTAKVLDFAFTTLGTRRICAVTSPMNRPSRRLMSRLGFVHEKNIVAYQGTQVLYAIAREDWLVRSKPEASCHPC